MSNILYFKVKLNNYLYIWNIIIIMYTVCEYWDYWPIKIFFVYLHHNRSYGIIDPSNNNKTKYITTSWLITYFILLNHAFQMLKVMEKFDVSVLNDLLINKNNVFNQTFCLWLIRILIIENCIESEELWMVTFLSNFITLKYKI